MSTGHRIPAHRARGIAMHVETLLYDVVERIELVGSLRRYKSEVGDIEFVIQPRMIETDLFGGTEPDVAVIERAIQADGWSRLKGGSRMLQYLHPSGPKLDLYLQHPPSQWGSLVAIRTGPARLGQVAVTRIRARGLLHKDGRVIVQSTGVLVPTPTEKDFFDLAWLPCVTPTNRDHLLDVIEGRESWPEKWAWAAADPERYEVLA